MPAAQATVATERPARYIKQLVSHLGRNLTTELAEDGTGTIRRGTGRCVLSPQPTALRMSADAEDAEELAALQDVVTRHLMRFAHREQLQVTWTTSTDSPVEP
jgi:caffeoyl-CoA O-methyltransferase